MALYRVGQAWRNDVIALRAGAVYDLTVDEAYQVVADCPGSLVPLSDDDVAALRATLAQTGVVSASFRPSRDGELVNG